MLAVFDRVERMLCWATAISVSTMGILSTSFGGVVSWLLQRLNHEGTKKNVSAMGLEWNMFNHRGTENTEIRVRGAIQRVEEESVSMLVLLMESS
jgi:hypothetical protein